MKSKQTHITEIFFIEKCEVWLCHCCCCFWCCWCFIFYIRDMRASIRWQQIANTCDSVLVFLFLRTTVEKTIFQYEYQSIFGFLFIFLCMKFILYIRYIVVQNMFIFGYINWSWRIEYHVSWTQISSLRLMKLEICMRTWNHFLCWLMCLFHSQGVFFCCCCCWKNRRKLMNESRWFLVHVLFDVKICVYIN